MSRRIWKVLVCVRGIHCLATREEAESRRHPVYQVLSGQWLLELCMFVFVYYCTFVFVAYIKWIWFFLMTEFRLQFTSVEDMVVGYTAHQVCGLDEYSITAFNLCKIIVECYCLWQSWHGHIYCQFHKCHVNFQSKKSLESKKLWVIINKVAGKTRILSVWIWSRICFTK